MRKSISEQDRLWAASIPATGIFAATRDNDSFQSDIFSARDFSGQMRVVITAGPSSEPIDEVRLITNRSTGELGLILAQAFWQSDHEVSLFLGRLSQFRHPQATYFDRNEDLQRMLGQINESKSVNVLLHAAALADFQVTTVRAGNQVVDLRKIGSEHQTLSLDLAPKQKVIAGLRDLFPNALIVGWKLELEGSRDDLVREATLQVKKNRTDACVINGRAFGEGFGFCTPNGLQGTFSSKPELAAFLVKWTETRS
jgi:phosphopantothenoylcysteine synthetase/decarboxylase